MVDPAVGQFEDGSIAENPDDTFGITGIGVTGIDDGVVISIGAVDDDDDACGITGIIVEVVVLTSASADGFSDEGEFGYSTISVLGGLD